MVILVTLKEVLLCQSLFSLLLISDRLKFHIDETLKRYKCI